MPLQDAVLEVPLVQGIDSKMDEKLVDNQRPLLVTNGTFDGQGRIKKRPGTQKLTNTKTDGTALAAGGSVLLSLKNQLLQLNTGVATGEVGQVYSYTSGDTRLSPRGDAKLLGITKETLVADGAPKTFDADLGGSDSFELLAYAERQPGTASAWDLFLTVRDPTTGAAYQNRTSLAAGLSTLFLPRVVGVAGLLYQIGTGGFPSVDVMWRAFNTASPSAIGAAVTVVTGIDGASTFDACARAAGGSLAVYKDLASGNWKVSIVSALGVITSTRTLSAFGGFTPNGTVAAIAELSNGNVGVAVSDTVSGIIYYVLSPTLTLASGGTVLDATTTVASFMGIGLNSSNDALISYASAAASPVGVRVVEATSAAAVKTAAATWFGTVGATLALGARVFPTGQPFYANDGGKTVPVFLNSTTQATLFLLRAQYSAHGRLFAGGTAVSASGRLPQARATTSPGYAAHVQIAPEPGRLSVAAGVIAANCGIARLLVSALNSSLAKTPNAVELDGKAYVSGACPSLIDGTSLVEEGFHHYPETPGASDAGVGAMGAGTYQYVTLYEWTDETGALHRSAPSEAVSVVVAASRFVNVTAPCLRLTDRTPARGRTPVQVVAFRTEAGGSIFYRVFSALTTGGTTDNDPSVVAVTIKDNTTDANLITQEPLYTTGGVLEALPFPAVSHVAVHQERVFGVSVERDEVAYTSQLATDGLAVVSHTDYRLRVPSDGGPLVAVASLEDKLIIFRRQKRYVVFGSGPNSLGLEATYTDGQASPDDIGCVDANSVVAVPDGILFRSLKGYYLLDRGLSLQYVGAGAEAYASTTVRRAVLVKTQKHVRFILSDGNTLVFNYEFGAWAVWNGVAYVDAATWSSGDTVVMLKSNGQLNIERAALYWVDEAGSTNLPYLLYFASAWLKVAGIAGFQRVRWVTLVGGAVSVAGVPVSPSVTMSLNYDYAALTVDVASGTVGSLDSGDDLPSCPIFLRHRPSRQKCVAIQVVLTEAGTPDSQTELSFSAIRLEVGVKKGSFKLPSTRTV